MKRIPFLDLARQRVVVLDGAMGSNLQQRTFDLQRDWMGHENISEVLNLTRPDVIGEIHELFLGVGCDAVETNTFGANRIVLAEAGMVDRVVEINRIAAQIARRACDKYETPDKPKYVIGSVGPGTKLLTLGHTDFDTLEQSYREQAIGLIEGGADVFLIETQQDILVIKAALAGINLAMAQKGVKLPIMVQASFDTNSGTRMLTGSDPAAFAVAMEPYDCVDVLGVNCAFGPGELAETVRTLCDRFPRMISALPNAGLPIMDKSGKARFPMTPDDFAKGILRYVDEFGVNIVGGCCGTLASHLGAVVKILGENHKAKARRPVIKPAISSLISATDIRQDTSCLIVAERTNTNGSRQFKRLLQSEDYDGLVSMARDEMRDGSHMLDVCVDFVGRTGVSDMRQTVSRFVNAIDAPLMLDSTNPDVMEAGLKLAGGRCVINSMNLEEGEERLGKICVLARKYGAAVVAGTIDEDKISAMARTADRKLSIAQRIRDIAVKKHGLRDGDLFFDPLVLPISTGIEEDRRNALETIEGTRRISKQLPECHTVVGLSNVSFGLKPAARVVLNSAFLHELLEAGLTAAIVHVSKILPRTRIPQEQWNAALDLIYDRRREGFDPLTHFVSLFPDQGAEQAAIAPVEQNLSIEDLLKKHIIDGEKRNLTEHLDEALKKYSALEIINNILLEGMKTVGELFGSGQMQLPFVLQSAQIMKAAVAHLEPHMDKAGASSSKGKIVLATVKGDVHDIGKNLVDIILSNNGYTVYNIGIKQPIEEIIKAAKEKNADAIGMSGLLVKSVVIMKENLEALNAQGIKTPVLLGGAALTRDYAEEELAGLYQGDLLYCKDAFDGLSVMKAINENALDTLVRLRDERKAKRKELAAKAAKPMSADSIAVPIEPAIFIPKAPFWGRFIVRTVPLEEIFPYLNTNALFMGQWGIKKGSLSAAEYEKVLNETAIPKLKELQERAAEFLNPGVAYGYFPVQSDGDELIVYNPNSIEKPHCKQCATQPIELLRFKFPRQKGKRNLCISDYFLPVSSKKYDVLGMQLVTMGHQATIAAEEYRKKDLYTEYLYLHGFAVEMAEALAEFWHRRMRQEMGISSEDDPSIAKLFQQKYQGSRYSFGYPACPNLADRQHIVQLLKPEELGVTLNENFMLVPEQSTDAIVVHHPQAKYFDV